MIIKKDTFAEISDDEDLGYVEKCVNSKNEVAQNLIKNWKSVDDERVKRW